MWQVHLVEDGDHRQLGLFGEVGVDHGLGFDALRRIDQQQRALARLQRLEHLVVEVDVPRGGDQVEVVVLAVLRQVAHRDGAGLDRDAALALEFHVVEQLGLHLPLFDCAGQLEQAVGERGLTVVYVGDDAEVANQAGVGHGVGGGVSSARVRLPRWRRQGARLAGLGGEKDSGAAAEEQARAGFGVRWSFGGGS